MKCFVVLTIFAMVLRTEGGTYTLNFIITVPAGTRNLDGVRLRAVNVTKVIVAGVSGQFKSATAIDNPTSVCYAIPFTKVIETLNLDQKYFRGDGWNIRCVNATYKDGETTVTLNGVTVISDVTAEVVDGTQIATVAAEERFPPLPLVRPNTKRELASFARFVLVYWKAVTK